jgi:hypothetical protein
MAFGFHASSLRSTADSLTLPQLHWLLGSLCALNHVPFDPTLLQQQFPPPYNRTMLYAAAEAFGFKPGAVRFKAGKFGKLPFPVIAFLKPQAANLAPPSASVGPADSIPSNTAQVDRIVSLVRDRRRRCIFNRSNHCASGNSRASAKGTKN